MGEDVDGGGPKLQRSRTPTSGERPPLLVATGRADLRHQARPFLARLRGIALLKCPVCLQGPLFRSPWLPHDKCPACGHHLPNSRGFPHAILLVVCGLLTVGLTALVFAALVWGLMAVVPPPVDVEPMVLFALGVDCLLVPRLYRHVRAACEHARLPTD